MLIKTAEYLQSEADWRKCPVPNLPEYAFIGRSNVGKSSLINMLTNNKNLAKTSSQPGKTQTINHFLINVIINLSSTVFPTHYFGCGIIAHSSRFARYHNWVKGVWFATFNEAKHKFNSLCISWLFNLWHWVKFSPKHIVI
jgi:hypothetical protein